MPDPQGLDVKDILVSRTTVPDARGQFVPMTVVRFFVGAHGPFEFHYALGAAQPERVTQDIKNEVEGIRKIILGVTDMFPPAG